MDVEQNKTIFNRVLNNCDEVDLKIAQLVIEDPAITDAKLAEVIGISRQTVNRRRNSYEVYISIKTALAIPEDQIRRLMSKALVRLEALMDHSDPKVRLAAINVLVKLGSGYVISRDNMMKYLGF